MTIMILMKSKQIHGGGALYFLKSKVRQIFYTIVTWVILWILGYGYVNSITIPISEQPRSGFRWILQDSLIDTENNCELNHCSLYYFHSLNTQLFFPLHNKRYKNRITIFIVKELTALKLTKWWTIIHYTINVPKQFRFLVFHYVGQNIFIINIYFQITALKIHKPINPCYGVLANVFT